MISEVASWTFILVQGATSGTFHVENITTQIIYYEFLVKFDRGGTRTRIPIQCVVP